MSKTIFGNLLHFVASLHGKGPAQKYGGDEPPLRAELFSNDQMEQHGKTLAGSHRVGSGRAPDQLLTRLAENEEVLIEVRNLLLEPVEANRRMTPAGEWLLDNFYLIEEQIRTAKRHLPKGYSRELPRLVNGPSAGLPRVYDIALETISHGDGRVDSESLSSFVAAYQTVSALNLGELWAIPIMLRLALIENLRRVAARLGAGRIYRNQADHWASRMTEIAEKDPKSLILVTADMARSNPPMVSSFVAEFARRLQGQSPALALPLTWIEQRLSESGLTIDQLVQSEHQQQAADQVSISNSIGSLRFLGAMDWREFVETLSVVDQALREDAGGVYGRMDFATRDRYRHAVEKIAKSSPLSEDAVARKAIQLAREGAANKGSLDSRSPCRILPDRQGPATARTSCEGAPVYCRDITANEHPVSSAPLSRRHHPDHSDILRGVIGKGACRRLAQLGDRPAWHPDASVRKSFGGRAGELAGDPVGDAASTAANGLLRRNSAGIPHPGRDPDDAHELSEYRGSCRGA